MPNRIGDLAQIDSTFRHQDSPEKDANPVVTPRTSVIDLWRQREKSAVEGRNAKNPIASNASVGRSSVSSGSKGYSHNEEKKENFGDEKVNRLVVKPLTPQSTSFLRGQGKVVSPATPSRSPTRGPKTPSSREHASQRHFQPITPDKSETESSPAFDDLRSKWADFGVAKSHCKEGFVESTQKPVILPPSTETTRTSSSQSTMFGDECAFDEPIPEGEDDHDPLQGPSIPHLQHPDVESTGRMDPMRRTKAGWSQPRPSPKRVTHMQVKTRVPDPTPVDTLPRLGKLGQKKHMLEKVKRRSRLAAGRHDIGSVSSGMSEDTNDEGWIPSSNTTNSSAVEPAAQKTAQQGLEAEEPNSVAVKAEEPQPAKNEEPFDFSETKKDSLEVSDKEDIEEARASTVSSPRRETRVYGTPSDIEGQTSAQPVASESLADDEMIILDEELQEPSSSLTHSFDPFGHYRPVSPETLDDDDTLSRSTTSHMVSTVTGYSDSKSRRRRSRPNTMIADEFVINSSSNVEAFQTTLKSLSLQQLANDISEEAATVLGGVDLQKISTDWNEGIAAASRSLTKNMAAASNSLNKFVGINEEPQRTKAPRRFREPSPTELVAIEIEYVEDDED